MMYRGMGAKYLPGCVNGITPIPGWLEIAS
jgi:hypothetical protein